MTSSQRCTRCIMDSTAEEFETDRNGVCNFCGDWFLRREREMHNAPGELTRALETIKTSAKGSHHALIGLSGGADSSYVAHLLVSNGIKPLAISVDNTWDTEIAKHNIKQIVDALKLDHLQFSVNWPQFREMQRAFLKASVPNVEMITDHAIIALLYQTAAKHNIKYIVHGGNLNTEGIMPESWSYESRDWKALKSICNRQKINTKGFPHITLWDWFSYTWIQKIKWFPILNYVSYDWDVARLLLKTTYGWKDYGKKHLENIFTRFFQAYILPRKFNVDKRMAHLSTLICAGTTTRALALKELKEPYYDSNEMIRDRYIVQDKLGFTKQEWEDIMAAQPVSHDRFPNNAAWFNRFRRFVEFSRKYATGNA